MSTTPQKPLHPELRGIRLIPRFSFTPGLVRMMNRGRPRPGRLGDGVVVEEIAVSETASIRLLRPANATGSLPVLVWFHGGGHLIGSPEQDDTTNADFVRELGIAVAAVRYRRGSDAPAPASVEDGHDALVALTTRADELGIDPTRIAVGGRSAGGGVAAGLVLAEHDRGEVPIAFQLLVYPMLDDRTVTRSDLDTRHVRVWMPGSNRLGWQTYLAAEPGSAGVSPYAAPARRDDLRGLPPTWIGVGDLDLFHDEDVEYARRLSAAGVPCELEVVAGAFHGFDATSPRATVSQAFWESQAAALRGAGITTR
jgi:acetyl esterase/lipase